MGSKRNVDMSANKDVIKVLDADHSETTTTPTATTATTDEQPTEKKTVVASPKRIRSKKYQTVRSQVDKTKTYDVFAAIELIKKLSYSSFDGTITADVVLTDSAVQIDVSFPHSTGKALRVAIVDDALLQDISDGKLDFDVLLTTPEFVPKLAKHARVLGPKGLMPNPKNGTITAKPEQKKKELESGKVTIKSERKFPLLHASIGSTAMEPKQLVENFQALIKALGPKAVKATLCATMSPSVKVSL